LEYDPGLLNPEDAAGAGVAVGAEDGAATLAHEGKHSSWAVERSLSPTSCMVSGFAPRRERPQLAHTQQPEWKDSLASASADCAEERSLLSRRIETGITLAASTTPPISLRQQQQAGGAEKACAEQ